MRRPVLTLATAFVLLCAPVASAADCPGADVTVSAGNAGQAKGALQCLVDAEREQRGLEPFKRSGKLVGISRRYAKRMRDEDFFSHTAPDGQTQDERFAAAGYRHRNGENLGYGIDTPRALMKAWLNSSIHRHNLRSKRWRFVGVGVAVGGSRSPLWVLSFGHFRS